MSDPGFLLSGVEPQNDPAWDRASLSLRAEFWREAGYFGSRVWKRYRAAGLDKDGRKFAPIHQLTAQARRANINPVTGRTPYSPMGRADENWAPLQATGGNSRLQTLLRWTVRPNGVWFYWLNDPHTGVNWGVVMARHAQGFSRHFRWPANRWGFVKGRDVFGFSVAELRLIKEWMANWWLARRHQVQLPTRPQPAQVAARLTTAEILAAARAAQPQPVEYVWRQPAGYQGRVSTGRIRLNLGGGGGSIVATPRPPRPPALARSPRYTNIADRLPGELQPVARQATPEALVEVARSVGQIVWRSALFLLLVEFIRRAKWGDVKSLFAQLGWDEPEDREAAENQLAQRAGGRAA